MNKFYIAVNYSLLIDTVMLLSIEVVLVVIAVNYGLLIDTVMLLSIEVVLVVIWGVHCCSNDVWCLSSLLGNWQRLRFEFHLRSSPSASSELWTSQRAEETQQCRNSCPWLQFLVFSLDSIMSLPL